ncbi:hypothetical protein XENTR_v10006464 [Xenopus tropicalis]|nr:hypothetical protein XENTR_v10018706 [Xenopus tropicalis]KAE8625979.1 hypothetical protein XENTR_v10006464 [Xenopus tropicalis]
MFTNHWLGITDIEGSHYCVGVEHKFMAHTTSMAIIMLMMSLFTLSVQCLFKSNQIFSFLNYKEPADCDVLVYP